MNKLIKKAFSHNLFILGIVIFFLLFLIAAFGPIIIGKNGLHPDLDKHLLAPLKSNIFGYGVNGISVLTWLIYGARMSFGIAFLVTLSSLFLGVTIGSLAGYFGGKTDAIFMRLIDILLAFPGLLLALYLASVMPPSIFSLVFALSASGWVVYARLVRARVLEIKNRDFVQAAIALGASPMRIILIHILPNILGPIIIQVSYSLSVIILAEAGLSFLGLGLPMGTPSWGALLDQGVANLFTSPYLAIFPGIIIGITVLSFNFMGDGLRDILDPKNSQVFRQS